MSILFSTMNNFIDFFDVIGYNKDMIKRERYIEKLRPFYDSDLIKIIVGIRRSGKSVIMEQIMDEIRERGGEVLYMNFEDDRTLARTPDAQRLIEYVEEYQESINGQKMYVFFDEVQEVDGWANACKTLRLSKKSLFITGSNSKLLSGEYTKEFSGRYVSLRVRPFVYVELEEYARELGREVSALDYLVWGGFPKRLEFDGDEARSLYFDDLNRSIVENDLIVRYGVKNTELFKRIVNYVLRSNARIFSARSIEAYLKNEHVDGSINTIIKYLEHLEDAYVIDRVRPFSPKTKAELAYSFKIYDADVSLNSIRVNDGRYDLTHNFENIVYNELIYRGYTLEVYNGEKGEIDFVANKDQKKYYIQVAYSVAEDKAYEREMSALNEVPNDAEKILITNDAMDYSTSVVRHVRFENFLQYGINKQ